MHRHDAPPKPDALVSVLTLTMDRPALLKRAAESIRYEPVDWVVVDGSKDAAATFAVFQEMRSRFHRSVYVHLPPNPPAFPIGVARNVALSLAQGKYCIILDDDDVLLPEWPRAAVEFLERNDCVAVYGNTYLGDENRQIGEVHTPTTLKTLVDLGNYIGTSAMVWRHNPLYRHEEFFWCCDPYDLWLQIARTGRIEYLPVKAFINQLNRLSNSASATYSCPECYKTFREMWAT